MSKINTTLKYKSQNTIGLKCLKVINIKKTDGLHESIIRHYWYFLKMSFKFQQEICNVCHDLMCKGMSLNNCFY